MDYELPDGSKVKLMGNSSLSYNRVTWFWERKLQLLGKALFKVTPGKTFTVQTEARRRFSARNQIPGGTTRKENACKL
mgnify:CR=1 FL=1